MRLTRVTATADVAAAAASQIRVFSHDKAIDASAVYKERAALLSTAWQSFARFSAMVRRMEGASHTVRQTKRRTEEDVLACVCVNSSLLPQVELVHLRLRDLTSEGAFQKER